MQSRCLHPFQRACGIALAPRNGSGEKSWIPLSSTSTNAQKQAQASRAQLGLLHRDALCKHEWEVALSFIEFQIIQEGLASITSV